MTLLSKISILCLMTVCLSCKVVYENDKLKLKLQEQEIQLMDLKKANDDCSKKNNQFNSDFVGLRKEIGQLLLDTLVLSVQNRSLEIQQIYLTNHLNHLDSLYNTIVSDHKINYDNYAKAMLLAQTELIEKQAKITKLNFEILSKQKSLDSINALLDYRKNENLRLERKLAQKDSVLEDLKSNISKKLNKTDLDGVFLTVDGGLLRITLKDTLLFETGKYTITKEGAEVINKITNILLHYKKYNVLVIGHTDNKAIKAHSNVKDNLDLSTARANAVTRLILSNKEMDGGRILSAGRGEYSPIAENKNESGRQKNRRVEVLLIPEKSIF